MALSKHHVPPQCYEEPGTFVIKVPKHCHVAYHELLGIPRTFEAAWRKLVERKNDYEQGKLPEKLARYLKLLFSGAMNNEEDMKQRLLETWWTPRNASRRKTASRVRSARPKRAAADRRARKEAVQKPAKLSIPRKTIRKLLKAESDPRQVEIDEVIINLRLVCPNAKISYFVFGARPSGNDDLTLIGHVIGERYSYAPIFIQCSLAAIQAGDWFGEEIPAIDLHFRHGPWKKIQRRYLR